MNILKALRDLFPHEPEVQPLPENVAPSYRTQWAEQEVERKDAIPPGLTLQKTLGDNLLTEPVSLSPDGRYLTSGAMDGSVRLWDPETGEEVGSLGEHSIPVSTVSWSAGGLLASGARDLLICLWNVETRTLLHILREHSRPITALAWSLDESMVASGAEDKTVRIWDVQTGLQLSVLTGHPRTIRSVAWSPDGQMLASADDIGQIRLWNTRLAEPIRTINAHVGSIRCLAWSPTQPALLVSSGKDAIVRIWDTKTGRELSSLEGHAQQVTNLAFSPDGRVLVSQSVLAGAEVYFWHTGTWELLASLPVNPFMSNHPLAFQTNEPLLLTGGDRADEVRIWRVDIDILLQSRRPTIQYSNAKVVLTGDSGVGKTGLFDVISGKAFEATQSTHARHVFTLEENEVPVSNGSKRVVHEKREILLWDLAGQPGYRVIHQLNLNQVTLGLVVFDGRSETDPFSGVQYWDRALRQAHTIPGQASLPLKKLLIAARVDRGGIPASGERINEIVQELGFDKYIETSAKEGRNIGVLRQAITESIEWSALPHITSNTLFEEIKAFLLERKEAGILLRRISDLYRELIASGRIGSPGEALYAQFERCIALVEARDLVMRLRFGDYILLQPERLDSYMSGLVNSVRDEPDGLGSILESWVKERRFTMPADELIQDQQQERLLLLAMVQDMLRRELALLEQTSQGNYLIFPSQSTRVNKTLPDPEGKTLLFEFEGSLQNIYATLAVRLSRSDLFKRKDLWKDAIRFTATTGGQCGLFLETLEEGHGRLTLFFAAEVHDETRFYFENYVDAHLRRWAIAGSVRRFRLFTCPNPDCREPILHSTVVKRRERGFDWLICSNCETRIDIAEKEERPLGSTPSQTLEMDAAADRQRNLDVLRSIRREEVEINLRLGQPMSFYDLFLCYRLVDKGSLLQIGDQLLEEDVLPWFDEWEIRPEESWLQAVREQMASIGAVAVFVGDESPPWQDPQIEQLLRDFAREHTAIIPVVLPDCKQLPQLPSYIKPRWIDMRVVEPDPMSVLIERIRAG